MLVSTPLVVVVRSLACGFGRHSGKGLFLCDGEATAGGLLDEVFVEVRHLLLECGAVNLWLRTEVQRMMYWPVSSSSVLRFSISVLMSSLRASASVFASSMRASKSFRASILVVISVVDILFSPFRCFLMFAVSPAATAPLCLRGLTTGCVEIGCP